MVEPNQWAEAMDFSGQGVIVAGGSKGIGRGAALAFAACGASVAVIGRSQDLLESLAAEAAGLRGKLLALPADLLDPSGVEAAVSAAVEWAGRIDVLVTGVGGFGSTPPLDEFTLEEWREVLEVNLTTVFLTVKTVVPHLRANGSGRIVIMSSAAARGVGNRGNLAYVVAKTGLIGLTRHLATELGPVGITVNAVAPGTTATERVVAVRPPEELDGIAQRTALKRMATIDDQVGPILFLASPLAGYMTGTILDVNAGRIMA